MDSCGCVSIFITFLRRYRGYWILVQYILQMSSFLSNCAVIGTFTLRIIKTSTQICISIRRVYSLFLTFIVGHCCSFPLSQFILHHLDRVGGGLVLISRGLMGVKPPVSVAIDALALRYAIEKKREAGRTALEERRIQHQG